jgi:hypothetical protein
LDVDKIFLKISTTILSPYFMPNNGFLNKIRYAWRTKIILSNRDLIKANSKVNVNKLGYTIYASPVQITLRKGN